MFTSDGQQCAAMLVENATTRGFPAEADLFVAQAVLQYVLFYIMFKTRAAVFYRDLKPQVATEWF